MYVNLVCVHLLMVPPITLGAWSMDGCHLSIMIVTIEKVSLLFASGSAQLSDNLLKWLHCLWYHSEEVMQIASCAPLFHTLSHATQSTSWHSTLAFARLLRGILL